MKHPMIGQKVTLFGYGTLRGSKTGTIVGVTQALVKIQFGEDNAGTRFGICRFRRSDGREAGMDGLTGWEVPRDVRYRLYVDEMKNL